MRARLQRGAVFARQWPSLPWPSRLRSFSRGTSTSASIGTARRGCIGPGRRSTVRRAASASHALPLSAGTYFILWPLSRLPLSWAGSLWMLGAWATATAVVATAVRRLRLRFTCAALVAAVVFLLPYAVLTIRSGNVQPYIIGMVLGALALSESRPAAAGGLMALAIVFSVWPLFLLPLFLRRRRTVSLWSFAMLLLLWLVTLVAWSPSR
jgi:uncharacterized membrane protein